jgi:hypothetical protein
MNRAGLLALIALSCACAGPPDAPRQSAAPAASGPVWFEEVAGTRGVTFVHRSGHQSRYLLPEIMGGGAALFDMDGDGDLDLLTVQSGDPSAAAGTPAGHRLYQNQGDGSFVDVSDAHGVAAVPGYGMGAATADYDNDGDVDVYLTGLGSNVLLQNDGHGRFRNVTSAAGVGGSGWSTSATFVDIDGDGHLDLFVTRYLDWSLDRERECFSLTGRVDYCSPKNYDAPSTDLLFRNNGNGTFADVSESAGITRTSGNGLGVAAADFDQDGRSDFYVANDGMANHLWLNRGNGTFTDEALLSGTAFNADGRPEGSMGLAVGDLDNDGDDDIVATNITRETHAFYRNLGQGQFEDARVAAGLAGATAAYTGFGTAGSTTTTTDGSTCSSPTAR